MSEGKKNIIASLLQEYDIKTTDDIKEALKDLLGGTIQSMLSESLLPIPSWELTMRDTKRLLFA